jgi:glycosyltransferase involved in cell wall biosynthesis
LGLLHLCNGLDPRRDGGMVPSILGFAGALARCGEPPTIVTPTPSRLEPGRVPPGVELIGPEPRFADWVTKAEVVHIHGLWQTHLRRGAAVARRCRVPYLVAAHGMADPWALRHKAWKKRMYTWLVERRNLSGAACLHALSEPEVDHLREFAPAMPVALVPNGVDLAPFDDLPERAVLERRHPELAGKRVVLFLGRLHRKKGLDLLGEALRALGHRYDDLHLLVAGRDEGARAELADRAAAAGLSDRITWLGHVSGRAAREAWGAADLFVLPSYSEGFSMAVLEAMAARKPVLISTACHFDEVGRCGAGLVVEPEAASVIEGLRALLESGPAVLAAMAERGRMLVEGDFTWDRQAARLRDVYRWLIGGGRAPAAVVAG